MGFFNKKGIVADIIRCDEPDYLIWKWHIDGDRSDKSKRANSIRLGSSLRVKDGSVAVFVYNQKNGAYQDYIEGPFDEFVSTKNLPILSGLIGLGYDGASPFQAEVYFINLARIIQTKFAVPFFDIFDPRYPDLGVPVAVRGTISYKIKDYKDFIKLHRLEEFSTEDFKRQINDSVIRYVKAVVSNSPEKNEISVMQLEQKIDQINDLINEEIKNRFSNDFGVDVSEVDVSTIELDKSSEGYSELKAVTFELSAKTAKARTEAQVKDIYEKQRIEADNYEETLKIQRTEAQYLQHKQTQSGNFAAYQVEKQAEVGMAGANALGKMGENGAGTISVGDGIGINPATIMAGMAVGGAVGQNIANTMKGILSNTTPPPIPTTIYYVAVNDKATGPYDLDTLKQMAVLGSFSKESLVWKNGMANWKKAEEIDELKVTFINVIPPIQKPE